MTPKTPKNARARRRRGWQARFLTRLAATGNVKLAAAAAGISRSVAYKHCGDSATFRAGWDAAMQEAVEVLEGEAWTRAVKGVAEDIWLKDQHNKPVKVGTVRKYSDTLLIFLLKARRPEVYRDRWPPQAAPAVPGLPAESPTAEVDARIEANWQNTLHAIQQEAVEKWLRAHPRDAADVAKAQAEQQEVDRRLDESWPNTLRAIKQTEREDYRRALLAAGFDVPYHPLPLDGNGNGAADGGGNGSQPSERGNEL
jgi:hypothetical protein